MLWHPKLPVPYRPLTCLFAKCGLDWLGCAGVIPERLLFGTIKVITIYAEACTQQCSLQQMSSQKRSLAAENASHRTQHFHDGNETFDNFWWAARNTDNAVSWHRTARSKHFDLHAKLLSHVLQLGTSLADDTAGLTLMYQHPHLRLITTIATALRYTLLLPVHHHRHTACCHCFTHDYFTSTTTGILHFDRQSVTFRTEKTVKRSKQEAAMCTRLAINVNTWELQCSCGIRVTKHILLLQTWHARCGLSQLHHCNPRGWFRLLAGLSPSCDRNCCWNMLNYWFRSARTTDYFSFVAM